ncbi:MAG TPA: hypothetical protein VM901_07020 [Bdellovibrionota bacterium]|jgi:hypothetical protein|nr:hypothetical protein [Bdellovibrionota bacterium]
MKMDLRVWTLALVLVAVPGQAKTFAELLASPSWGPYTEALVHAQRKHPYLYRPLESLRLDLLPAAEVAAQVQHFADRWTKEPRALRQRGDVESAKDKISDEANRQMQALVQRTAQQNPRLSLSGTTREILATLPEASRLALTPLDEVFQSSTEVGKKIGADLRLRGAEASAYRLDEKSRAIEFSTGADLDSLNYTLKAVSAFEAGLFRLRGLFGNSSDPVGTDVTVAAEFMRGTFFNPSSTDRYEFGTYPKVKDRWVDERGATHFGGDGHKH